MQRLGSANLGARNAFLANTLEVCVFLFVMCVGFQQERLPNRRDTMVARVPLADPFDSFV